MTADIAAHAEQIIHQVPVGATVFFGALLALMILALALEEKLHAKKSVIVGVFAIFALLLGSMLKLIPFGETILPGGHGISIPVYITAVDWKVISIIVGSSVFVDVTSRSGLFSWIAIRLTKTSNGDPLILLWYYGVMTVVFFRCAEQCHGNDHCRLAHSCFPVKTGQKGAVAGVPSDRGAVDQCWRIVDPDQFGAEYYYRRRGSALPPFLSKPHPSLLWRPQRPFSWAQSCFT